MCQQTSLLKCFWLIATTFSESVGRGYLKYFACPTFWAQGDRQGARMPGGIAWVKKCFFSTVAGSTFMPWSFQGQRARTPIFVLARQWIKSWSHACDFASCGVSGKKNLYNSMRYLFYISHISTMTLGEKHF